MRSRKLFVLASSRSRSSVLDDSSSSARSVAPATAGASEFENRYGRLRWRSMPITSREPAVQPPSAPPSALPNVVVMMSTRPPTPWCSQVPRPVLPMKPVAWLSSTISVAW